MDEIVLPGATGGGEGLTVYCKLNSTTLDYTSSHTCRAVDAFCS